MNICPCCGKPTKPPGLEGMGTALKPAMELIAIARKPLSEPTIALNILRWGTGALNIDRCRVEASDKTPAPIGVFSGSAIGPSGHSGTRDGRSDNLGRWPANLCHDGSPEVLAGFPDSAAGSGQRPANSEAATFGSVACGPSAGASGFNAYSDAGIGSAARFFYSAKADADDRMASKHPTVKPVDLMQWLVRLVTPPNGVVLDCFSGTGTTGEAAWREGFSAILIEREAEYQADIARRMEYALAGPEARKHAIIKAKGKVESAGPLFGDTEQPVRGGGKYSGHKSKFFVGPAEQSVRSDSSGE